MTLMLARYPYQFLSVFRCPSKTHGTPVTVDDAVPANNTRDVTRSWTTSSMPRRTPRRPAGERSLTDSVNIIASDVALGAETQTATCRLSELGMPRRNRRLTERTAGRRYRRSRLHAENVDRPLTDADRRVFAGRASTLHRRNDQTSAIGVRRAAEPAAHGRRVSGEWRVGPIHRGRAGGAVNTAALAWRRPRRRQRHLRVLQQLRPATTTPQYVRRIFSSSMNID